MNTVIISTNLSLYFDDLIFIFNSNILNSVQTITAGTKLSERFYNLTLNCTNGSKGVSVADGFELTVANNLLLTSGDLRLVGEAQLIQNGIVVFSEKS